MLIKIDLLDYTILLVGTDFVQMQYAFNRDNTAYCERSSICIDLEEFRSVHQWTQLSYYGPVIQNE